MCGRYVLYEGIEGLKMHFPVDMVLSRIAASYNIAPTQKVAVILLKEGKSALDGFHWGLVPFWAKEIKIGSRLINARVETVEKKPAFRTAFKKRRCLIPANGFYEWKGQKGKNQPMYIAAPSSKPFAFAGLWETWDKEDEIYNSCTILTMPSSESVSDIHTRMPVILEPSFYKNWLDPENQDQENLKAILEKGIITELSSHPVSMKINNVQNNDPSNIETI